MENQDAGFDAGLGRIEVGDNYAATLGEISTPFTQWLDSGFGEQQRSPFLQKLRIGKALRLSEEHDLILFRLQAPPPPYPLAPSAELPSNRRPARPAQPRSTVRYWAIL